jgi:hypothetical protein
MFSKKESPQKIKHPNEHHGGIAMEINYNKPPSLLQGSRHLIEEVDRVVQMMKGVDAEEKINGMILTGK